MYVKVMLEGYMWLDERVANKVVSLIENHLWGSYSIVVDDEIVDVAENGDLVWPPIKQNSVIRIIGQPLVNLNPVLN